MDVKYIPKDWEKMRAGIGDLIGLGPWGKGMIDSLKDLSDNLEDIEQLIAKYDSDGVISFHHTSQKSKYQALYEDFQVLHGFTGKVGDIVDRTIDERFYTDIDAFVEEMRDLSISNYTTKNRLGISETVHITAGAYNSVEIEKPEISLDDIFSGDNFYGKQMKLEYEAWKELNPNQDFSQNEYQQAIVNTRAFEYESISDSQEYKEFWFQIGALVVIIGATLICPPAGMALGVVYGAYELSSAVSGKDLVSGRELETSERWVRGLLAPLDIVPGVSGLTKFSSTVRLAGVSDNMGKLGLSSGVKGGIQQGASRISNLVETASKFGSDRLRRAGAAFQNSAHIVKNKVIKDTIEVAQVADKGVAGLRKYLHVPQKTPAFAGASSAGKTREVIENTHTIENGVRVVLNVSDEVKIGSGVTKGTGYMEETFTVPKWSNDGNYDKVRGYRGRDLTKYEEEYLVDPRLVVEMNFKGKNISGTNAAGWERNAKKFFNTLLKSNPEFWSAENTALIKRGRVPIVDEQFIKHFPQYKEYIKDTMRHHHIGEGGQAVVLPKSLHPGYGGIHNVEKEWGITGIDDEIADRLATFINNLRR